MDRLRQVILLAAVAVPFASGCAGLQEVHHQAMQKVGLEPVTPASEFACAWQNRLAQLPDPTKNGASITGLPGQMFLYSADGPDKLKPAVPTGDLTISVIDETPRPAGYPRKPDEVWHFTKDKLEKMIGNDERFGKSFILFVPWPDTWRDVSRVRLKARYDQPIEGKTHTLYAQDSLVTLDFIAGPGGSAWAPMGQGGRSASVPDPANVIRQMKANGQTQPPAGWQMMQQAGQQPVVPAGYTIPVQQQPQMNSVPQTSAPQQQQTTPGGFVVPAAIPQTR